MEKQLVNIEVKLQRFPGKGGWTYAALAGVVPKSGKSFGFIKVRGFIDGYEIGETHIMPMGKGHLFLPVKASIRQKIKKEAGDKVHIKLFIEERPDVEPSHFLECLQDEPKALDFYNNLADADKRSYLDFISAAHTEEKRIERIILSINSLLLNKVSPPDR